MTSSRHSTVSADIRSRMNERRIAERVEATGKGRLILPNGASQHVGMIDISSTGARLKLSHMNRLPNRMHLNVPEYRLDHRVYLAWQTSYEVGVYFF